jgi:hypothetical protein
MQGFHPSSDPFASYFSRQQITLTETNLSGISPHVMRLAGGLGGAQVI